MNYFLDISSPETYKAFGESDRSISGFRLRHKNAAERVKPGDRFVCYMTGLSRWFGVLEVLEGPFHDDTPRYFSREDPYVIRFRVRTIVHLPIEKAIPIRDPIVWDCLSFTRNSAPGSPAWTGHVRKTLVQLSEADGRLLEELLVQQAQMEKVYPLSPSDERKFNAHRVRRADKDVTAIVPDNEDEADVDTTLVRTEVRESIRIQALLPEIGSRMGMQIWLPRSDRAAVESEWKGDHVPSLEQLPLNYDEITLKTIEQIDVLWLRGRSIRRAFEVEHTTSVYSGILRMADLLALQPNMEIRLHIVAPPERRDKVLHELRRPVFSLLERGPLSESCTYLSYDSLREPAAQPNLAHFKESVLDDYEEGAEE